jgi:hypothetical protein
MTSRPPTFDRLASAVSGQTLSDGTEAWWDYPGFLHLTFGVDRLTVCVNPDEDSPRTTLVVQIDDDGRSAGSSSGPSSRAFPLKPDPHHEGDPQWP